MRTRWWLVLVAALCSTAPVAGAQQRDSARADSGSLLTRREMIIGGAAVVGAVALMPTDGWIRSETLERDLQGSAGLRSAATTFTNLGDPGTVILSLGTYAVGRVIGSRPVSTVGLHATEALLLSAGVTELMKGVAGRDRPYVQSVDGDEYAPFRGFTGAGLTSFPSGHTSAAFSLAAVVAGEGPVYWPHAAHIVTPAAYAAATLVGLSRIYLNRHWMSDVVVGAVVGTYSGLLAERFNHRHPHNALARWLLPAGVGAAPGGMALVWSVQ